MPFITALHSLRLREAAAAQRRDRMRTLFLTVVCDTLAENPDYETNAMLRCVCVTLRVKFASFGPSKACMDMMRTYAREMRERAGGLSPGLDAHSGRLYEHDEDRFLPRRGLGGKWCNPSFFSDGVGFHFCCGHTPTISATLEFGCRIRIRWVSRRHDNEMVLRSVRLYENPLLSSERCEGVMVYTNFRTGRVIPGTFDEDMLSLYSLHDIPWNVECGCMSFGEIRRKVKETRAKRGKARVSRR
jgi:hypothetical protein